MCTYESAVEHLMSESTAMTMLCPRNFDIKYVHMSDLCDEMGIHLGTTEN
jgi:hypothetical protein